MFWDLPFLLFLDAPSRGMMTLVSINWVDVKVHFIFCNKFTKSFTIKIEYSLGGFLVPHRPIINEI